jgi:dTDP-4-amino-4,6-dideoxygalactose transaminase
MPPLEAVTARLEPSFARGQLTNGRLVEQLEAEAADRLGVSHVVAVASCTSGLMLALRALVPEAKGDVVLPSFTFSASAHAVAWNGLTPRFAECDRSSFQLDVDDAGDRLEGAVGVLATHVFGAPCRPPEVEGLGRSGRVPVVFDAAHAFGATWEGRPVGGFGDAEIFSLSPTKLVVAGEGGLVATDRDDVAAMVRLGRDYGNPGDYDTRFVGLNARMSELHAALALESLALLDEHLERRRRLAQIYRSLLASVDGISVQAIGTEAVATFKDFTISISEDAFGFGREALVRALAAEGIDTRRYFSPPVHRQRAYASVSSELPITDDVAARVLSLPMFADLEQGAAERVCEVLALLQERAEEVRAAAAA